MANPTTVSGFDLYPSTFVLTPQWIGGPIRRALSGKGYRKFVAEKLKLTLAFEAISGDELANIRVVWTLAKQGSVSITNTDYGVSSTFLSADQTFNFTPQEGPGYLYSGSLTFEEV